MPLDWSNERYVRYYVRETPDEAVWCWQAVALWPQLLRRADRAGVIETRKGLRGLAAITKMPLDLIVEPGMADLLEDGCIVETQRGYAIPNYIEAQTAKSSGKLRNAEYKARARAADHLGRELPDVGVTQSGHSETIGDAIEDSETPGDSVPNRTEPYLDQEDTHAARGGDRHMALVHLVLRRAWEAETALHAELCLATLKPSPIAPAADQALAAAAVRGWIAESKATAPDAAWDRHVEYVAAKVEHLVAVRTEVSRVFRHTRWWAPATFWAEDGIGKDLRRDPATVADEARRSQHGRDSPPRRAAVGRAPPAATHSTEAIDPQDITP
jgi:hypothetical protein